jgi:hypothetical protein
VVQKLLLEIGALAEDTKDKKGRATILREVRTIPEVWNDSTVENGRTSPDIQAYMVGTPKRLTGTMPQVSPSRT